MPRPITGSLTTNTLADGSRAFVLRFPYRGRRETVTLHERPGCTCGCGGSWDEQSARTELGNVLALARVGLWKRPEPPPGFIRDVDAAVPTFAEYKSTWRENKKLGVYCRQPLKPNSLADLDTKLMHLERFFGPYRLDEIDGDLLLTFKARTLARSAELREAIAAGADLRDERGRRLQPLGPSSIRGLIGCLANLLDDAIEDGYITHHAARSKRMRVFVPKPDGTFLENDELAAVLDAARDQDVPFQSDCLPEGLSPAASRVAGLLANGLRTGQIAAHLGLAKSTVTFHVTRLGVENRRGYASREATCTVLGYTGVRVSELCDLKIGQIRVSDREHARFLIPDAKTETGIREVQTTPDCADVIVAHIERLRSLGYPTGPDDYLIPNSRGGRSSRKRLAKIVREAAALASERLVASGLPPLPAATPHTLRRTYVSLALIANKFDVKWVMGQVGHADSKMTLDVYAKLEQRIDRTHGSSFDQLVRDGRNRLPGQPRAQRRAA